MEPVFSQQMRRAPYGPYVIDTATFFLGTFVVLVGLHLGKHSIMVTDVAVAELSDRMG